MTRLGRRLPGQPLYALICLIMLYVGVRAVWWQSPFPALPRSVHAVQSAPAQTLERSPLDPGYAPAAVHRYGALKQPATGQIQLRSALAKQASAIFMVQDAPKREQALPPFLYPALKREASSGASPQLSARIPRRNSASRWSVDGWVFYRPELSGVPRIRNGVVPSTYGASQSGAVIRYRLAPGSLYVPASYVRVTAALDRSRQQELAAGVSARPMPGVPVTFAAEARASRQESGTEIRPAVFAYTEFPPLPLPLGLRAEIYGQAGYVGGSFATPFADGSVRIDRQAIAADGVTLRAGTGFWGGVQNDAGRLDIGPTVTADVNVAGAPLRLAVDYRHRVAGDAQPQSGVAVTVSTGF